MVILIFFCFALSMRPVMETGWKLTPLTTSELAAANLIMSPNLAVVNSSDEGRDQYNAVAANLPGVLDRLHLHRKKIETSGLYVRFGRQSIELEVKCADPSINESFQVLGIL